MSGTARLEPAPASAAVPAAETPPLAGSVEQAYERIVDAIIDHRLPPQTRLVESRLCEIFGLGRTRVRQVLQRLANERLVTLLPNRGAIVCKPTPQDAREVFEARRLLEAGIVAKFVDVASDEDIARVRRLLTAEHDAFRRNDRRAMIRLSGDFHVLLAEVAGNRTLTELLRELVWRSSLIVAVYQAPGASSCPPHEHEALCAQLAARDPTAAEHMLAHLDHVLDSLQLTEPATPGVDLAAALNRA